MEDRSRQHGILKVIGCGVIFAFAMVGAVVVIDKMATSPPKLTSTVQISRQGSSCQRLVIDNSTGAIKSSQQIACGDSPIDAQAPTQVAPSHYPSGGRIDGIRASFRNR